jgi:hypothetical protein
MRGVGNLHIGHRGRVGRDRGWPKPRVIASRWEGQRFASQRLFTLRVRYFALLCVALLALLRLRLLV